ncbi:tetratricopeptide repeat protein [Phycisphaera mikurensis]|uniref:Tetratricopeptide repeat protein n=1 Tax=Phycisphaera mikurensis (strain NBRC 102666 / KCTC 22515 / FYK2301M01) TaxID=1142394 RepID=I0IIJ4_PHYMF|nr:tetratricopeptide repeat protein [Phycisphaera mikurensis]MBB6442761.1 tetratricopeptide (TPR) repeat protein [Phycisphaera mikurensis]BAM05082.1 hypothetical protein PSMK_29230 [Phycisphaera mikurensis NBRC 102666]
MHSERTGEERGGGRRAAVGAVGVVLASLVALVAAWVLLGGLRPAEPLSLEAAQARAAELGERMRAGVQNGRDVRPLAADLEALVAERPDLAAGWTLLGQVRLLAGRGEAAHAALARSLELRSAGGADAADAELHLLAGGAAEQVGRLEEAEAHFASATRLAPRDARATLRLAHAARRLGRGDVAATLAEKATRLDAGLATAWGLLGHLRAEAGDDAGARAALDRAVGLTAETGGPEARAYALSLARLLLVDARPLDAARVLRLPDPDDFYSPAVMALHAEALAAAGEPGAAANYHERWLALDPANALAAAEATRWYLAAGDPEQAAATLVVLERIDPRDGRLPGLRAALDTARSAAAAG